MMQPLNTQYRLACPNPCRINNRIAREMNLDGIRSQYPFACTGEYLVVYEKDKHLLGDEELQSLTPYEPTEEQ